VLIGSTQKMGAGTNVQAKLIAWPNFRPALKPRISQSCARI
jgi:hypothetical protein